MRVLTIAHNAVAESNRMRAIALSRLPGVEVTLLTPPWWFEEGRRIEAPGERGTSPPRPPWWRVGRTVFTGNGTRHLYLTGLIEALRATRPDVVDLYEEPFSLVALQTLLLRALFVPRAAVVFYSAVNVQRTWRWPYRWIERLVLRHADGAHAPSQDVPAILEAKGFRGRPVSVIPLGVDFERFSLARPMELPSIRRPRIGFVGRLEPVKGLDTLLDAFERLTTPASLIITGDGSLRVHLQLRIESFARVARSEAAHAAHILPPVSYDDMPAFLKSLDLLVLPSVTLLPLHREQFGRVLVEAMAAGVPVIGSSSGAIPEVIGDAGLVVPEGDAAALSRAIDSLLRKPSQRQALIERGQKRARDHFAWRVLAEQTLALFDSAIAHRRQETAHLQAASA